MDSLVPTHGAAGAAAGQTKARNQPAERRRYRPATEVVFVDTASSSADAGGGSAAGAGNPVNDAYSASSVPIYQTATFKQTSANGGGEYDYSRSGNPTRSHLESHIAKLMSANRAYAVASGMSALDVITRMVKAGEEIVAGDDIYGGTHRLLTYLSAHSGVRVHHVDTSDPEAVLAVLNQRTRLVLLETPTNPLLTVCDVPRVAAEVHRLCKRALVVVDNTMMSPYLQKPLELDADIVYHSGTKYLSGHHDLMAGVIGVRSAELAETIYFIVNSTGCGLSPFDSWLLLRGIKTLAVRLERQQANAMRIAQYLEMRGFRVFYPGLASHPQRELHYRMSRGPGAVLSFVTGDVSFSERIVEATRLWGISVSFGCVNSLISMPCRMSHASIPAHVRAQRQMPEDLIRLCIGIEDVDDLLDDLESAIRIAGAPQSRVRGVLEASALTSSTSSTKTTTTKLGVTAVGANGTATVEHLPVAIAGGEHVPVAIAATSTPVSASHYVAVNGAVGVW